MTDLNKLKAKIEALRRHEAPENYEYNDALDHCLDILATHAAEPAPVAVEGSPRHIWANPSVNNGPCDGWEFEGFWHADEGADGGVKYIRADLAHGSVAEKGER